MKATINKIEAISNSQFNIEITVNDDSGKFLYSGQVGFNAVFSDAEKAVSYIRDGIKNRANQYLAEIRSVAKDEVEKLIGQEFSL